MDALLRQIHLQPFSDAGLSALLQGTTQTFIAFVLVVTRVSGLLVIGPMFGHPDIPLQMRVLLAIALSLLLTPSAVGLHGQAVFSHLDGDHSGLLEPAEVPAIWESTVAELRTREGKPSDAALTAADFRLKFPFPESLLDLAWLVAAEFGLGLALGLGVLIIMTGLQLAGNLIDSQLGVSLGEVFNPELETPTSFSSDLLYLLGTVLLLGVGGHILMISALVDTFRALPVGYAQLSVPALEFLRNLVHQSFSLSLQVAAPIIGTLAVVGLTMGYLSHSIPQINVLTMGFPVRTLVGLWVVIMSLTAMGERWSTTFGAVLEQLRFLLTGMSPAG